MHPFPGATVRFADFWVAVQRPVCWLRCWTLWLGWINPLLSTYTSQACGSRGEVGHETNFSELSWIKKLSSSQLLVDWNWALNLRMVYTMVHRYKSDWQAALWRRALWYLRWLHYWQIIILPIRVPFSMVFAMLNGLFPQNCLWIPAQSSLSNQISCVNKWQVSGILIC